MKNSFKDLIKSYYNIMIYNYLFKLNFKKKINKYIKYYNLDKYNNL